MGVSERIMVRGEGGFRPLQLSPPGGEPPLLNSATTAWAGVPFELHRTMPNRAPTPVTPIPGECHLRVVVDGFYEIEMRDGGREIVRRGVPGTMSFHADGTGPRPTRIEASATTLVVRIDDSWLQRVLDGTTVPGGVHQLAHGDATARALSRAMCQEVSRDAPTGALFAESLSQSLLAYALDRLPMSPMRVQGGLSNLQARKLRRYIDDHLAGPLRVAELAALCGLRPRQFGALFRRSFGATPYQYVMQRRVARAADLLGSGARDIDRVASQVGFASQSHFTTAFRRARGVTPARFRR